MLVGLNCDFRFGIFVDQVFDHRVVRFSLILSGVDGLLVRIRVCEESLG